MNDDQPNIEQQRETEYGRQLRLTAAFGMDMRAFMNSAPGKYLTARANADREAALEELADIDPEKPGEIRKVQNKVKCAESFLTWMADAISEGEIAEQEFTAAD